MNPELRDLITASLLAILAITLIIKHHDGLGYYAGLVLLICAAWLYRTAVDGESK